VYKIIGVHGKAIEVTLKFVHESALRKGFAGM
jgi:hypothetical protein